MVWDWRRERETIEKGDDGSDLRTVPEEASSAKVDGSIVYICE